MSRARLHVQPSVPGGEVPGSAVSGCQGKWNRSRDVEEQFHADSPELVQVQPDTLGKYNPSESTQPGSQ